MPGRSGGQTRSPPHTRRRPAADPPRGRSEERLAQPATHVGKGKLRSVLGFRKGEGRFGAGLQGAGLPGAGAYEDGPRRRGSWKWQFPESWAWPPPGGGA